MSLYDTGIMVSLLMRVATNKMHQNIYVFHWFHILTYGVGKTSKIVVSMFLYIEYLWVFYIMIGSGTRKTFQEGESVSKWFASHKNTSIRSSLGWPGSQQWGTLCDTRVSSLISELSRWTLDFWKRHKIILVTNLPLFLYKFFPNRTDKSLEQSTLDV